MKAIIGVWVLLFAVSVQADVMVFAAASTTDAVKELAALYKEKTGETVRCNFASSGALAHQIEAGAPADVYLSANTKWMSYLVSKKCTTNPVSLLKNRLVLVTPKKSPASELGVFEQITKCKRLAVGDFKSVPAGAYAKQALEFGGVLEQMNRRLIKGDSVRRVLFYVERGEVDAGIVYSTDAKVSRSVKVAGLFPMNAHAPILYPVSGCASSRNKESAAAFLAFLQTPDAAAVFEKFGFEMAAGM